MVIRSRIEHRCDQTPLNERFYSRHAAVSLAIFLSLDDALLAVSYSHLYNLYDRG
jgi:hypothetical protein